MHESQFWIAIWRIVGACFCVLVLSVSACTAHQNRITADAAKGGEDPVALSCAMTANTTVCATVGRSK